MSPSNPPGPGPASSGPSRVPIPKATHKPPDQNRKPGVPRPYRAARACLTCKSRKVRCNSALPKCSNCVEHATSCVYPTIRKDRLRVLVVLPRPVCRSLDIPQGNVAKPRNDYPVTGPPAASARERTDQDSPSSQSGAYRVREVNSKLLI